MQENIKLIAIYMFELESFLLIYYGIYIMFIFSLLILYYICLTSSALTESTYVAS